MYGKSVALSLSVALLAALALAACETMPPKAAPAKPAAVATATAAPAACKEEPGQRKARVAGDQTVSLTTCARPAGEWTGQRPGLEALRPHLNP
jgi:putative hemolysin